MPTGIQDIGQIALSVSDLARAIAFYRDTLGLLFLFETAGMAFLQCGSIRLMLSASHSEGSCSSILYYRTGDIQATAELLRGRGITFEQEPRMIAKMPGHELWMAFFRDSENNLCALMSEVR